MNVTTEFDPVHVAEGVERELERLAAQQPLALGRRAVPSLIAQFGAGAAEVVEHRVVEREVSNCCSFRSSACLSIGRGPDRRVLGRRRARDDRDELAAARQPVAVGDVLDDLADLGRTRPRRLPARPDELRPAAARQPDGERDDGDREDEPERGVGDEEAAGVRRRLPFRGGRRTSDSSAGGAGAAKVGVESLRFRSLGHVRSSRRSTSGISRLSESSSSSTSSPWISLRVDQHVRDPLDGGAVVVDQRVRLHVRLTEQDRRGSASSAGRRARSRSGSRAIGPPPPVRFRIWRPMFSKRFSMRCFASSRVLPARCSCRRSSTGSGPIAEAPTISAAMRGRALHVAADAGRVLAVEDPLGRHRAEAPHELGHLLALPRAEALLLLERLVVAERLAARRIEMRVDSAPFMYAWLRPRGRPRGSRPPASRAGRSRC